MKQESGTPASDSLMSIFLGKYKHLRVTLASLTQQESHLNRVCSFQSHPPLLDTGKFFWGPWVGMGSSDATWSSFLQYYLRRRWHFPNTSAEVSLAPCQARRKPDRK